MALAGLVAGAATGIRRASRLSAFAALIWPLQAGIVAVSIAALVTGDPGPGALLAATSFAALGALRAFLTHRAEALLFSAATTVVTTAREEIVRREISTIRPASAAATAALANEKLDMLVPYITRYAPARARAVSVPLAILALAFWQSWAVGLVLLITGPLIPVFMALIGIAAKEASRKQLADIGTLNDLLMERLSALLDIRLLDAGQAVIADFGARADGLRAKTMTVLRIAFLSSTVLELFAAIGVAMVAVYVGFALLGALGFGSWGAPLTPAAGLFLLLLAPDFYQPLRDLSAAWHDKASALAVAGELAAAREDEPRPLLGRGGDAVPLPGPATIALRGVTVVPGNHPIRYPDLVIRPGESVALMGPSGSGKTTLLQLIAGLRSAETGEITVAGQKLDDATADAWRARLGWMPQAPHFLNASLARNISFGQDGDLEGAMQAAAIEAVVEALPAGLQTRLGETGGGLSGGEARRITLARAIFSAPDILFADEPTADLDAVTAQAVMAGLDAFSRRGGTLVVATHDPVLAARMDRTVAIGATRERLRELIGDEA